MNKDTLKGDWNQIKGKIKAQWSKLTDEHIDSAKDGSYDTLKGHVQKAYGLTKEKAEEEFAKFKDKAASSLNSTAEKVEKKAEQLNTGKKLPS